MFLLTALIFVAVTLGVFAGYQFLAGVMQPDAALVRSRLTREFDLDREERRSSPLFGSVDEMDLDALEQQARGGAGRAGPRGKVAALLAKADLKLTVGQVYLIAAGLALGLGLVGTLLGSLLVGVPAALAGVSLPLLYVQSRVRARRDKLLRQLPGAFEMMARVLKAGSSVPQALQAVSEAFEDPLSREVAQCQRQLDLGLSPEVTYQEMAHRCGVLELRIFVMAMMIQRQTGGNLSEVLERLAAMLRARHMLRQHLRTLTAEGRMQGWVLSVLPFFVLAVMLVVNRDYAAVLFEHAGVLVATAASVLFGLLWIRHIVNFEV